ncbi:MAG TPA: WecB/TagA/CpsF family glycosyltransferase [Xanthobacteraceae bacterium]|jgi:exopolysaccharide biosynthesis WecB/TagA/CpsF family protein
MTKLMMTTSHGGALRAPAQPDWSRPAHEEFLGLSFCPLSQPQVARLIIETARGPYRYVVTPNAYHVAAAHDEPERLLPLYRGAWMSLCDSRIVRGLAALTGRSLPLVTGSDLVPMLLAELDARPAAADARRVLVVGPDRGTELALRAHYRCLNIQILPAPSGLGESADLRLAVAHACVNRRWDILLLCVGCPAQELIARLIAQLGRPSGIALCVGASIDFLTGRQTRAPLWLQKLSLEWAYRLALEPRRLWRRYLIESPKILRIFFATRQARRR